MRFGRSAKASNSGRHRNAEPAAAPSAPAELEPDHELESYLSALLPNGDPEATDPGRPFGSAQVYQLRLPSGAEEKVLMLAEQYGMSPLTMLQGWVLQRLHQELERQDQH